MGAIKGCLNGGVSVFTVASGVSSGGVMEVRVLGIVHDVRI